MDDRGLFVFTSKFKHDHTYVVFASVHFCVFYQSGRHCVCILYCSAQLESFWVLADVPEAV